MHSWAGRGYNRGMAENESVGPEQSTPAEAEAESEVIEGFKSAGLNEMQAFRTA